MDEAIYYKARNFLDPIYNNVTTNSDRPFITLTFAQSLDGKIAKQGQQVLISGKESLAMTHRLRILHDGIMVGIGTALIDNPQLNARYVSANETPICQPQPIVLDPFLKLPTTCKLVQNYINGQGKQPWLIVSERGCNEYPERKLKLENAGVKLIRIKGEEVRDGHIGLEKVFQVLKDHDIHKLMVEGGSKIIQSCLEGNHWDQLIMTIGPMFIGPNGVSFTVDNMPELKNIKYEIMGKDCVMAATK
ncbi:dihydrofolate reductase-like domain-containing protein [Cokeromyces recurvatus]|uniref:dihydrofolate reductase-like domain-containing protein n=1 Tax=Cokeromyces recurvatus TaxID=90255 RepID=UPI0022204984|nr:dihydrofolate reductase-like domain-containing protein [Cokeromyces recurvatus]KAI7898635.1 dihydrofolate reductase-like domain-containing protein [Cokeromyces recurvatus]